MDVLKKILSGAVILFLSSVLTWNCYLHGRINENTEELHAYKLYVAEHNLSKQDLKEMFAQLETRFNRRIDELKSMMKDRP
ncbi:MAG: hypothetical protein ACNI27_11155 [Desulfovibrio sp.]